MKPLQIEDVARICHEMNREYCISIGDDSQVSWDLAPEWQKYSAIDGVVFHLKNPKAGPEGSHENWLKGKLSEGWKYGPVKDAEKRNIRVWFHLINFPVPNKPKIIYSGRWFTL